MPTVLLIDVRDVATKVSGSAAPDAVAGQVVKTHGGCAVRAPGDGRLISFEVAVGALAFRYGLKGSYFALVTLAFAEVFRILNEETGPVFVLPGQITDHDPVEVIEPFVEEPVKEA